MKLKLPFIALALSIVMLLSGCIQMNVNQSINPDGTSHVEVSYDASEFIAYMQDFSETEEKMAEVTTGFEKSCDEFLEKTTWANPACSVSDDYVATMSGEVVLSAPAFTAENKTYRYDVKDLYNTLSAVGESQDQDFSDEALLEQKETAEMTGIKLTYNLTMPGTIVSTEVGTVSEDGSMVSINLFDIAGMETAVVISEAPGRPLAAILGGLAVLLVIVGVLIFIKKKKKKGPEKETIGKEPKVNAPTEVKMAEDPEEMKKEEAKEEPKEEPPSDQPST